MKLKDIIIYLNHFKLLFFVSQCLFFVSVDLKNSIDTLFTYGHFAGRKFQIFLLVFDETFLTINFFFLFCYSSFENFFHRKKNSSSVVLFKVTMDCQIFCLVL